MQKGFYRFYPKEKWINRNIEIEDSLYTELKNISENELDASINKLIDSCVENFKIENEQIIFYKKPKDEITIARSIDVYKRQVVSGSLTNSWSTKQISE